MYVETVHGRDIALARLDRDREAHDATTGKGIQNEAGLRIVVTAAEAVTIASIEVTITTVAVRTANSRNDLVR